VRRPLVVDYEGAARPLKLAAHESRHRVVEQPAETRLGDYERLLGDAIAGDATLFARQDVVEAAWAIVDPLLADPGPMFEYEAGS
jgi:glucose-6-phosphate 1-dehydrogenase